MKRASQKPVPRKLGPISRITQTLTPPSISTA